MSDPKGVQSVFKWLSKLSEEPDPARVPVPPRLNLAAIRQMERADVLFVPRQLGRKHRGPGSPISKVQSTTDDDDAASGG